MPDMPSLEGQRTGTPTDGADAPAAAPGDAEQSDMQTAEETAPLLQDRRRPKTNP